MYYSLCAVGGMPSAKVRQGQEEIGAICELAARTDLLRGYRVCDMVARVRMPIRLHQFRIYYNHFGQLMGYLTWAWLSHEVEARVIASRMIQLEAFEWNEGTSLWIVDFVVLAGGVNSVLADLRDNVFSDEKSVAYFRYRQGKKIAKRVCRDDASNFWRGVSLPARVGQESTRP